MLNTINNLLGGETKRVAALKNATGFSRPSLYLMNLQLSLKSESLPSLTNLNGGTEQLNIETTTNITLLQTATAIYENSRNPLVLEKQVINSLTDAKRSHSESINEVTRNPLTN